MNETEFKQKVDEILAHIEAQLEDCESDLDWDLADGILDIECEGGSHIIINRQVPTRQIWVATRADGYHFDLDDDGRWRQGEMEFFQLLNQTLREQCGEPLQLIPSEAI